jgi:hypothetical protein
MLPCFFERMVPFCIRRDFTSGHFGSFVHKKRFHFRSFWPKFASFTSRAWHCPLQDANAFHRLDWLLHNTEHALTSWSARSIGSVRAQLELAKEVRHQLEMVHDHWPMVAHEDVLRCTMKLKSLGQSSLQRTIAKQELRIIWLSEGDAPNFFSMSTQRCGVGTNSFVPLITDVVPCWRRRTKQQEPLTSSMRSWACQHFGNTPLTWRCWISQS